MQTRLEGFNHAFLLSLALVLGGCGDDGTPAKAPRSNSLPQFQEPSCDRWGEIELSGQYMVQNDIWNDEAATVQQCVTALWNGSSSIAGMLVDPVDIDMPDTPASYPSIVYGWQWGPFHGAYTEARRVDDIRRVPTTWRFSVPADARYNASYVLWLHPMPSPPDGTGTIELMIWVADRDATPIGELVDSVELEGATWEVWTGPNVGRSAVTYRRTAGTADLTLDLLGFVQGALVLAEATPDWYLLGVQAGFELWRATDRYTTESYEVRIE